MPLLFISRSDSFSRWREAFAEAMPELEVRQWPEVGRREEISYALAWKPPAEALEGLPNLKVLFSLGAGVDALLELGPALPDVPIVRMV